MDPAPEKAFSVGEAWVSLNSSLKASVCTALYRYSGNDVGVFFERAVRKADAKRLELEAKSQLEETQKRKAHDRDTADAQPALKRPKVSEAQVSEAQVSKAPAPLQAKGIDLFRQTPVKFGQPTNTAATGNATPTTWSSSPTTGSTSPGNTQGSNNVLFTGPSSSSTTVSTGGALASSATGPTPTPGGIFSSSSTGLNGAFSSTGRDSSPSRLFGFGGPTSSSSTVPKQEDFPPIFGSSKAKTSAQQKTPLFPSGGLFGGAKANAPAQPEPDCDEQFTFADRRFSKPPAPPPPPLQSQFTQYRSFEQSPSSSADNSPQAANRAPPVSAVYKPPFAGVDMSSLKIPANSNVSLTLNVFQAPSSLHQVTGGGAPRTLKCIQCGKFYMEDQNTALQCRRHTGRCVGANDPKLSF
ncbi:hypothetical protein DHEL01_v212213 [Diaporthe helianthi]|uniref:Uncharacterized protein n=1 Tax=Diaporthe helianthi TaxID=158607 RepID=A0A2P5HGL3_DIAHE|nr:hypothetical protein DHEL01_v212213 [Diaporthe helianthi]